MNFGKCIIMNTVHVLVFPRCIHQDHLRKKEKKILALMRMVCDFTKTVAFSQIVFDAKLTAAGYCWCT